MSPSRQLQVIVHRIASGELRGEAAFDAVVWAIAATETPPGASEQVAAQIRDEVVLGVSHDRALCELIYGAAETSSPAAVSTSPPSMPPAPAVERGRRREDAKMSKGTRPPAPRLRAAGPGRRGRKRRAADDSFDDVDSESSTQLEFADQADPSARRNRIITGASVVVGLVLLGAIYFAMSSSPCDDLVDDACKNLGEMCDPLQARARLKEEGVNDTICATAQEGVASSHGDAAAYREALTASLGFDLLGEQGAPAEAPEAKPPPEPLAIVAGQTTMSSLFVDASHVYWTVTQPPAVYRIRSIGGEPELISQTPMPGQLGVSDNFAYWVSAVAGAPKIWADKIRGEHESVEVELVEGYVPGLVAFMGPEAAFVDANTGAVQIVAVASDTPRQLAAPAEPKPIAVGGNGQTVVWSTPGPSAALMAAPREGGAARILAQGLTAALLLRIDDTRVYWSDPEVGSISSMPLAGGETQVLVPADPGISDVAVGSNNLYWTNAKTGNLSVVPKGGGEPRVVVTGLQSPRHVELDRAAVYWESGGVVYRLPK